MKPFKGLSHEQIQSYISEILQGIPVTTQEEYIQLLECRVLLKSLIYFLVDMRPEEEQDPEILFLLLYGFLNSKDDDRVVKGTSVTTEIYDYIKKEDPAGAAYRCYQAFKAGPTGHYTKTVGMLMKIIGDRLF